MDTRHPSFAERWGLSFHALLFGAVVSLFAEILLHGFREFSWVDSAARVLVVLLGLMVLHRFALASAAENATSFKNLITLTLMVVGTLCIIWLGRIIALSVGTYVEPSHPLGPLVQSIHFAIPFAGGALLLQAVLGREYVFVFGASIALMVGLYFPSEPIFVPLILATSLIPALSLRRFRSRVDYIRAGLQVSLVALPFAFASALLDSGTGVDHVTRLGCALLGGALCTFVAAGFLPVVEHVGGYVTDMRLIEMATLDHPLLKSLSVQCPGSWNHSMVMGMMVEAAADAIGANPVLARVGAYFHDVGKITKPLYFVENQLGGENRHDKLSPSMSALIIRSHVKEGIELAREHGVPKAIEDMIPQHHGTSVIEYFLEKARKEAEELGESTEIDPSLYTYPGPKPQTKEAGILMLADGIEAAARTVSEPSLDRIQGLVQKMINKVFSSGELDECDLTLRDLHSIAKSFTRVLNGIYHQRVAYAEPAEKTNEREEEQSEPLDQEVESGHPSRKQKGASEDRPAKEHSKEDLKRLGL